ncbi:MAG: flagellar basal body-associated FliL family protein [Sedimentisphaerales bacterium]|nr:flagellar basal body-associated FliL family protein [Sedimentisphaerales bacterium]
MAEIVKNKKSKKPKRKGTFVFLIILLAGIVFFVVKSQFSSSYEWDRWKWGQRPLGMVGVNKSNSVNLCEDMLVENWYSPRRCLVVECTVAAKPENQRKEQLKKFTKKHESQIKDRIRSIISSIEPDEIRDPQLKVFKNRVQQSLRQIDESNPIEKILVPKWNTYKMS